MSSSGAMKRRESKDWPFAVFMTGVLLIALVGVILDPSCRWQRDPSVNRLGPQHNRAP